MSSPVTGVTYEDDPYEGIIDYEYLMLMQDETVQELGQDIQKYLESDDDSQ